jgi:SAM-dependent methyltransferase
MQVFSQLFNLGADARVIELGGGDNPTLRPNVDIRPGPNVDIVADLNEPLPLESDYYDRVFSQFLMEHLRLPRLRGFISEVHRILKPGGIALIITANLLEQARVIIDKDSKGEMADDLIYMIFGGNPDYPENYHHCSLTPNYAMRLFREVGFYKVDIYEHPVAVSIMGRSTDMIIQAQKSRARILD